MAAKKRGKDKRDAEKASVSRDLVELEEAMAILKTSRSTLYRWVREGRIRARKAGRQWRFEREEIDRFLKGDAPRVELRTDIAPLVNALDERAKALGAKSIAPTEPGGVQRVINQIIGLGLHMRASDIHLAPNLGEPGKAHRAVLRYRVDGVLHSMVDFDGRLLPAIVEHWKMLAACNPQEREKPQDGRMHLLSKNEPLDVRVTFLPAALGETLTARILPRSVTVCSLDQIDYSPENRKRVLRWLAAPWGMLVVAGPAGCGKTTTLYAWLNHLNNPRLKIMTVEDPVEYMFPGMVQVQLDPQQNVTFATAVRALLRSDPDVIMIGELRDGEVLRLAQNAALTGHLVMSSLHANDAIEALGRMVEMGRDIGGLVNAAKLIVAQRLVRLVCPHCSKVERLSGQTLASLEGFVRRSGVDLGSLRGEFRKAMGCPKCKQTGYAGRTLIAEMLEVTPEIGERLGSGAPVSALRAFAVSQGMSTMAADGVRKAAEGRTTLDEVMRVAPLAQ